jgi:hypothetical protein
MRATGARSRVNTTKFRDASVMSSCLLVDPPDRRAAVDVPAVARAQVPLWGACGGLSSTPAQSNAADPAYCCEAGSVCTYLNDWYWQCLPFGELMMSANAGCFESQRSLSGLTIMFRSLWFPRQQRAQPGRQQHPCQRQHRSYRHYQDCLCRQHQARPVLAAGR